MQECDSIRQEIGPGNVIRIVPWHLNHVTKPEPMVFDENIIEMRALAELHTAFFQ